MGQWGRSRLVATAAVVLLAACAGDAADEPADAARSSQAPDAAAALAGDVGGLFRRISGDRLQLLRDGHCGRRRAKSALLVSNGWIIMAREIIATPNAPKAIGTYSQAVKVGKTVYVSGQIALDPKTGELQNSSIEVEIRSSYWCQVQPDYLFKVMVETAREVAAARGIELERLDVDGTARTLQVRQQRVVRRDVDRGRAGTCRFHDSCAPGVCENLGSRGLPHGRFQINSAAIRYC